MGMIMGFLSALMGLRTLIAIMGGLGIVAAFLYGQHKGDANCKAAYELALAKEEIEDLKRQRQALESTIERQNEIEARHEKEQSDDDQTISELKELIAANTAAGRDCPVAATADELRGIRAIGQDR
jgi:hypothetical protein